MENSRNDEFIIIKGAREHNLKNISLSIPRDKITVITGLSGSGKSSLAFDTIFSEGQRRYVESLSNYARQFIETTSKPEVESIDGLSPAISIQQKTTSFNPRSTVGTVTEVYDYLRLLFARIATPYCPDCHVPIQSQTRQNIADQILALPEGSKLAILAPMVRGRKGEYQKELVSLRLKGFSRVNIDGEDLDLSQQIELDKNKKHNIDVYVDRFVLRKESLNQKPTAATAENISWRILQAVETAAKLSEGLVKVSFLDKKDSILFSEKFSCPGCGLSLPAPEPRTFSFNSPMGACQKCDGLGLKISEKSLAEDPEFDLAELNTKELECESCHGVRLKKDSLCFKIAEKDIGELSELSLKELKKFFDSLKLSSREILIGERILKEIKDRLLFLNNVGVGYLSLLRSAYSLSGGESQRIRLATQIGSSLTGVIYVLDEPSIGLHQRDNEKLLESLKELKRRGNTVIVVEHDEETIMIADHIVDLGPKAGTHGGEIVGEGTAKEIMKSPRSLTGKYLSGALEIPTPKVRRKPVLGFLEIVGATGNNLKNVTAKIPLGLLTCITGVSGSGKSTLIIDTLYPYLMKVLHKSKRTIAPVEKILGAENVDKIIDIDQSPIGRTPRSNPATYTGIFDQVRNIFSNLPESKIRGFKPGRFSFNVKGGRCENCQGAGAVKVELTFLPDVYVHCDICDGKRFNPETLAVKYRGSSIADVLAMTIDEAFDLFEAYPILKAKLKTLKDVGLGYITLGQSSITLSGGEAQRVKLATELSKRSTGKTIYILDEPSTGLHFDDVKKLIDILQELTDQGNTVLVIEHNIDIIKSADYIIDMGPEGGAEGGQLMACGSPEAVARESRSLTGRYLIPKHN